MDIDKEELETFLRNVPNPVLLAVFGENCTPCEELEEEITNRKLPGDTAFAKVTLGNEEKDIEIADMLGVETVPTVIGFCQGQELGRTSDPKELDNLINSVSQCKLEDKWADDE